MAASRAQVGIGWRLIDGLMWLGRKGDSLGSNSATGYLLIAPAVALVGLLVAGLAYLVWISFHEYDPFRARLLTPSVGNYQYIFGDSFYLNTIVRTTALSAVITLLAVAVALPYAYVMVRSHSRRVRLGLLVLALVPFLTGEIVRAYGWLLLLGRGGVVSWVSENFGVSGNLMGTRSGVIVATTQIMVPLCALILLPALRGIDPDLQHAASTLGARPRQVWWHVLLPSARNGLALASAVAFSLSMTQFAVPSFIGLGLQDFVANAIYTTYFARRNIALGSALGVMLVLVVVVGTGILLWLGQKRSLRRSEGVAGV